MINSIGQTIQGFLLPISPDAFPTAVSNVTSALSKYCDRPEDKNPTLLREWNRWVIDEEVTPALRSIVSSILSAEEALPKSYIRDFFKTYAKLRSERFLPAPTARALLGNTLLIQDLLENKQMSCTQICRVLSATQSGHEFNFEMIKPIARALGLEPKLKTVDCELVYSQDESLESQRFADASSRDAIEIIGDIGAALGYQGSLADDLSEFHADYKPGYGIMLHFSCLVSEFYDHPPMAAPYEFNPRGQIAVNLAKVYHRAYTASESPYLNNAKGASNLDESWAWSRKEGYVRVALALAMILGRLGAMPYASRKQLSPWIRQWLLRKARETEDQFTRVLSASEKEIRSFLDKVPLENTRTRGILDQRAVDFLASQRHPSVDVRGLGDFVNASNTQRQKTGDIEFMWPHLGRLLSYEAHGGTLTQVYVDLHRQSLRQVLRKRDEELVVLYERSEWEVEIVFVAHKLFDLEPYEEELEGYRVSWNFLTYADMVTGTAIDFADPNTMHVFNEIIVDPLNQPWVPEQARIRYKELAAASSPSLIQAGISTGTATCEATIASNTNRPAAGLPVADETTETERDHDRN